MSHTPIDLGENDLKGRQAVRWSNQFIPTVREIPQEAEIPSHQLMLRAGLIRRLSAGLYTYLPLGLRALHKVVQIVREEMDRAGALEVLMPALQPREIWEESGRYQAMRDVMFTMSDRQSRALVLGPTHEEVITGLAAAEIRSYRQLPMNFYQIQTKFRDEIRPRFGLMRSKEFIMKDAYSFDVDQEAASASYQVMYEAYRRIFLRCGLRTTIVQADSGAMGGASSHEFMVVADAGEDGLVECPACGYAANLERAEGRNPASRIFEDEVLPLDRVHTPGACTVDEVSAYLKIDSAQLIKTLIYKVDDRCVAVLVPGNRDVNEIKLQHVAHVDRVELACDDLIEKVTGAPVGFAGPVGLQIPIYADRSLKGTRGGVTGANKQDAHLMHVDLDRDASIEEYVDVVLAQGGDACPRCDGVLTEKRGIEVGHVFNLGTKYSEALNADYIDADGELKPAVMGCYGIGISRTLQSVIEQSYDKDGILWPLSIAPYQVEVMVLNIHHEPSVKTAEALIVELEACGIEVLYDDRDERPGVKFKDADLIGIPIRVGVGERSLTEGFVEIKIRGEATFEKVSVEKAGVEVVKRIDALRTDLLP